MKMKPTTLALLSSLLLIPLAAAQDATITTAPDEAAAAKQRAEKLLQEERAKALLEKKPVVYSGFLVEASRAKEKKRFFSLRQPRDAKNDYRNIAFDERTNRPRGFVLFRIGF